MVKKIDTALASLHGDDVGAVSWLDERGYALFEYEPAFLKKGIDISPIHMGIDAASGGTVFSFPSLSRESFYGLPGLLADCLPDKFGNALIDAWLARNGRSSMDFNPIERLCYTGRRGMGGLEFRPTLMNALYDSTPVEIKELVRLSRQIIEQRFSLDVSLGSNHRENSEAILDILRVGTSAGGARPKAIIAMNDADHVLSGQAEAPPGYEYWILKFDGVADLELGKPEEFGRIEYGYYLMAMAAGISMTTCRLLEEHGRAHFMTRRFDRKNGDKVHMQSLCGLAHYDFNLAGGYGYEQAFTVMRKLRLSRAEAVQQYRRMVFNVLARNQDDHTKNIAFLMDNKGKWHLSPAFDVTYSHNPAGRWTSQHQMSINGKRDLFLFSDLISVGESISLPRPTEIVHEVAAAVSKWPEFARQAGLSLHRTVEIGKHHRLDIIN